MADKVTITAKTGPGLQATALVLNDIGAIKFDLAKEVLTVDSSNAVNSPEFDLRSVATVTFSISSRNYTITVSE